MTLSCSDATVALGAYVVGGGGPPPGARGGAQKRKNPKWTGEVGAQ